ncbi:MAG: carboxypeptidase-like regulatory domain-containing protein [Campylobacterota bacterium]|nr:carboxypeptidase-like regulatory domain-containing protein [Campylobacterota bacterium]
MVKSRLKSLLPIFLVSVTVYASEIGTITVFTFNDGQVLTDNEVKIDGKDIYKTDKDGSVVIFAEVGVHQIEIFGKDSKSLNLGYLKKPVIVKEDQDTQVIATFNKEKKHHIEIDTPLESENTEVDIETLATGRLNGLVFSSEDKKGIANARVFVKGTSIDARTDKDGKFSVLIPAQTSVSISVVHSEYSAQTIKNINVKKSGIISREVELTPASMELEEFVVLAPKVEGTIATIMEEEKKSKSISNILGAQEMSKKGDSSAASALKRVTGVTLIGGKSIYVRGLGDRYSNIEMNSMPLPSPDPTKRVVPLDIFPSGVIKSMKVQKSATADVPHNFGGGYVDIHTKDSAKKSYLKIAIGAGMNSNTGKSTDTYQGSSTDFLGFDSGYRDISPDIINNSTVTLGERLPAFTTDYFEKEELSVLTQKYADRNYNVTDKKLPFGFKGSIEGAKNFEVDDHKITLFGNYSYDQEHKFREESYYKYDMQKSTGKLYKDASQSGTTRKTINQYSQSAIFNIGYNYLDVVKVKFTKLYTHTAENKTRIADGIMGSNDEDMTKYYLDWEERTLDVNQLNGELDYQIYNKESHISFGLESATAELNQPNNYTYTFRNEGEPFLDNKISNNIASKLNSKDELMAFYLKNKLNLELLSDKDYIEFGFAMSAKERISRQNKFFLRKIGGSSKIEDSALTGSIETIYDEYVRKNLEYDDRAFMVSQLFTPADYFDAEVDESSIFLSTFVNPSDKLNLLVGLRYIDFKQVVYQYKEDRGNEDMSKRRLVQRIPEELTLDSVYPSLSTKYKYDDNNHFDLAFSQTYIVPDLREFTEGEYFHPYDVATVKGNPNLETTNIYNFDIKYSHYFSDTENIKVGLFFKQLDKPIEDVMIPSSSLPIYSYDNADSATLYGLELDGRKSFQMINPMLKEFYLSGNFSYTDSDVTLRKEQEDIYSTNHRQLQGLSQIVLNLSLGYEKKGRSLTLSYNKMGERIRKVGMIDDGDAFPDYYEIPAQILDFVWIEKFQSGIDAKFKLGNIIDEETLWKQGSDNITNKFKKGRTFSFGIGYKY